MRWTSWTLAVAVLTMTGWVACSGQQQPVADQATVALEDTDGPVSTFDHDREGWMVVEMEVGPGDRVTHDEISVLQREPTWQQLGGNPGGHLSAVETVDTAIFFEAPEAFLGDQGTYLGGTLRFDLRSENARDSIENEVALVGNNGRVFVTRIDSPRDEWTQYRLVLHPANFVDAATGEEPRPAVMFSNALSDLAAIRIPAEWDGLAESATDLDNVAFVH